MKRKIIQTTALLSLCLMAVGCGEQSASPRESKAADPSGADSMARRDAKRKTVQDQAVEVPISPGADGKLEAASAAEIAQVTAEKNDAETASKFSTNRAEKLAIALPSAELVDRATRGEVNAQRELAKFYNDQGQLKESSEWYLQAALKGDAEAQRMLGLAYTFGHGVQRSMEEAGKWFLLSAEQGDAVAQRELGKVYGDQWKFTESNDWYLKAALQGDAQAQRMLGLRYTIGQGVESNRGEALKWFLAAANQGDAQSQRELGKYYGEQWKLKESNEWYLKAALQGDAAAQHMMGVRYVFGQGVERNTEEAGKWFLLAAEQGDAQSQFSIGQRWARGEAGEAQDFAEAAKWFRLSAEQGLDEAQLSLGRRYADGSGVEQDFVEAYKWMWLAQNNGKIQGAAAALAEIEAKMTAAQIEEARKKADAFIPKPPTALTPP